MAEEFSFNEGQLQRISRFVTDHFKLCQCKHYVCVDFAKDKNANNGYFNSDDCACGRSFEWHATRHLIQPDYKTAEKNGGYWSNAVDTYRYPCNTFGKLLFAPGQGFDSSTIVPGAAAFYARLPGHRGSYAHMERVYKLMTAKTLWALPAPQLIIEVAGMARKLQHVDQEILDHFTTGLIKAAKTAKAWIVTGGTNAGVMGLVGDAVSKSRMTNSESGITCVGIASWGVINNREQLMIWDPEPDNNSRQNSSSGDGTSDPRSPTTAGVSFAIELRDAETPANTSEQQQTNNQNHPTPRSRSISTMSSNLTPIYCVERPENCEYGISLNPGHNCFLFIDNGREKRFGEEVAFRAHFLHYLSQKTIRKAGTHSVSTPLVLLVVGGGITTLKTVELSIANRGTTIEDETDEFSEEPEKTVFDGSTKGSAKDKMSNRGSGKSNWARPAIILPHFGGVSDLLAFAYEITAPPIDKDSKLYRTSSMLSFASDERSVFPADFDARINKHPAFDQILQFAPEELRAEEGETAIRRIRSCLKYRHMLTVVDLSDDHDYVPLDQAILNAILKSNFGSPTSTFELAFLWNRVDVAKRLLMRYEKEINQQVDMKAAMTRSLMNGQSEFFKLFIEYGLVDLHAYLTLHQIRTFYTDIFLKRRGKAGKGTCVWLFRSMLLNWTTDENLSDVGNPQILRHIGHILSRLLGCYMDNVFTDEISFKRKSSAVSLVMASSDRIISSTARLLRPYETSMRDLFILQLLLHRRNLAVYVWKRGHDHIGTALMAASFLNSLAKEANGLDMTDLGNAYKESASEWENRAISLLGMCYEQEPLVCSRLLTRSLLTWQGATPLEIAFYGKMKQFMEQPAVQTTLTQVWMGRLATFTRQRLVYLALFPPLLPFLIFRLRFEKVSSYITNSSAPPQVASSPAGGEIIIAGSRVHSRVGSIISGAIAQPPSILRSDTFLTATNRQDVKLTRAALFGDFNKEGRISVFTAIYLLYASPIAKYAIHSVSLVSFLFLFSFFLLDGPQEEETASLEIVIWICCAVYFFDVIREGFGKSNLTLQERLYDFFSNIFVIVEILSLLLVIAAGALRLSLVSFVYPHTIYCIACVIYWLKSLRIFLVTETIGPKVITLFNMIRDLTFFMLIYVILLLSFSVPLYTLTYPHQHIHNAESYFIMLRNVVYVRMWNIFTAGIDDSRRNMDGSCEDLMSPESNNNVPSSNVLAFLQNSTNTTQAKEQIMKSFLNSTTAIPNTNHDSSTFNRSDSTNGSTCGSYNILAVILYIIYLFLTNIMLLNMLIAMFAHTVDKTRLSATRLWRFNMYRFLYEYYTRPVLPGPFMIFELTYRFIIFVYRRTCAANWISQNNHLKHFYPSIDDYEYRKMEMFERNAAETSLAEASSREQAAKYHDTVVTKLHYVNDRIHNRLDCIEARLVRSLERRNNTSHSVSEHDEEDCEQEDAQPS